MAKIAVIYSPYSMGTRGGLQKSRLSANICFPANQVANDVSRDAEFQRDCALRFPGGCSGADRANGCRSKEGSRMLESARVRAYTPTFCEHIAHVFQMSPGAQMGGVTTSRVIARVHNRKPCRDWSVYKLPREATSCDSLSGRDSKFSIAMSIQGRDPWPTFFGASSLYFIPESLFGRSHQLEYTNKCA